MPYSHGKRDRMTFSENLEKQLYRKKQVTENGAVGYKRSGKRLLDLNFAVSSMRNWSEDKVIKYFAQAYYEDPLLAVKWLFYARDIRGCGMGERRVFRLCMRYLVKNHWEYVQNVIRLVPEYGRYDDWLCLFGTAAEDQVVELIREQLRCDLQMMEQGKQISLLAKWLPSCNTSSAHSRDKAKAICNRLELSSGEYRRIVSCLRKYLNVVEVKMTADEWDSIEYDKVPSRANLLYRNAFLRNDELRRRRFLDQLKHGETKINAHTLFPSDIVAKYYESGISYRWSTYGLKEKDDTLEVLWNELPDYVKEDDTTLVVRDGSGSMQNFVGNTKVTALNVATALTVYFAEHCQGQYRNRFITFSSEPQMIDLSNASSLREKLEICEMHQDCSNTDIRAVFDLILSTALEGKLSQEELPKNILIVSDMEFDHAIDGYGFRNTGLQALFEQVSAKYVKYGYRMPRLIFWNICSRTNTVPLRENELGVALVSGYSPAVYRMVLSNELDPYQCLVKELNSERYQAVEDALQRAV